MGERGVASCIKGRPAIAHNMNSRRRRNVADDRSLWDTPFKPEDTFGLAQDIEEHDAIARRIRLSLPLQQRMNVWLRQPTAAPVNPKSKRVGQR